MTGEELYNMNIEEIPFLIKPLFQKTGVVALVGSSDTGKSTILRQLAISIITGKDKFLDEFEILAEHKNVIYISTEDDKIATAHIIRKQADRHIKDGSELKGLRFLFNDTSDYLKEIEKALEEQPADCIIIDAFTDLFGGELNASNKVRLFIHEYDKIATKYKTLIIFLHHTGKRTDQYAPSKDNVLGSQGFESRMRCVVELRADPTNNNLRHFCIVKGNYIAHEHKKTSYVLEFMEDLNFKYTGKRIPFEALKKSNRISEKEIKKKEAVAIALRLKKEGLTIDATTYQLKEKGFTFARSTIGTWLKKT